MSSIQDTAAVQAFIEKLQGLSDQKWATLYVALLYY
jgi:hypothetical protein